MKLDRLPIADSRVVAFRVVAFLSRPVAVFLLTWSLASAQPSPGTGASLGEQLYSTHCDSCHTSQVHWRDKRIAKDWTGLVAQVRRWQSNIGVRWSDEEVLDVTRYLNARYYHFVEKEKQASVTSEGRQLRYQANADDK